MDFDCHLGNGGRQELFRLNIPELRVPAECREYLEGNMRDWYWPKIEINELTELKLEPMCCFKVTDGMIEGEGIVPKVMRALGCGEE